MAGESPKSLLDFVAPALPEPPAITRAPRSTSERCGEPQSCERLLLLGFSGDSPIDEWQRRGVEVLIYCDREKDAVEARKKGFRAVLAQSEYLEEKERFDLLIQEDSSYRIYDVHRALTRMARSLRPGGRLCLQIPLQGHRGVSERLLDYVADEIDREKIESLVYPRAEDCRRIVEKVLGGSSGSRVIHRTRWIAPEGLEKWGWELLGSRAVRLDTEAYCLFHRRLVDAMRRVVEEEGAYLEEEVLLQVEARKP